MTSSTCSVHTKWRSHNAAEVPSVSGCATQGESFEELLGNLYKAAEGCLSVGAGAGDVTVSKNVSVLEFVL